MSKKWPDLYIDGSRLDRVIRLLETKLKKTEDDDKIIKYANSIAYLTSKKIEIVDRVLGVQSLIKNGEKRAKRDKDYDEKEKYQLAKDV